MELLSSGSSQREHGPFALKEAGGRFSVSVSQPSPRDSGVYWCAVKRRLYRAGFRSISIQVEDSSAGEPARFNLPRLSAAAPPRPEGVGEASRSRREDGTAVPLWLAFGRRLWVLLLTGSSQATVVAVVVMLCGAALVLTVALVYAWRSRSGASGWGSPTTRPAKWPRDVRSSFCLPSFGVFLLQDVLGTRLILQKPSQL